MIKCRGECGKTQTDESAAEQAGWVNLEISRGYRCGACARELSEAGRMTGTDGMTQDTLSKDSRGALPKETTSTILPASVKG